MDWRVRLQPDSTGKRYMPKWHAGSAFYELFWSDQHNSRETTVEVHLSNWFEVSAMILEKQLPTS